MIHLRDVSSPIITNGSDTDLQMLVPSWMYQIVSKFSHEKRPGTIRLEINKDTEMFIVDDSRFDEITYSVLANRQVMVAWSAESRKAYTDAKVSISHLNGADRKIAKAKLAGDFGLLDVWSTTI